MFPYLVMKTHISEKILQIKTQKMVRNLSNVEKKTLI